MRPQKAARDLSPTWDHYRRLRDADEVVLGQIRCFADEKRITLTALESMGTRWTVRTGR
jgi:hypothetical protein